MLCSHAVGRRRREQDGFSNERPHARCRRDFYHLGLTRRHGLEDARACELERDAQLDERALRDRVGAEQAEEHVLGADPVVAHLSRFLFGQD